MAKWWRSCSLLLSLAIMAVVAGVGIQASRAGQRKAEAVHRTDRANLQTTLAGLTNQYLRFVAKDAYDAASAPGWTLTAGDGADRDRLNALVQRSTLIDYGAVLTDLHGRPLNATAPPQGLPAPGDPGFGPMMASLLQGQPGLSSVLHSNGVPLVGVGVPVVVSGVPRAVLVGLFRADRSALQTYAAGLRFGRTGQVYVVDSSGTVVAGTDGGGIGRPARPGRALTAVLGGRTGFIQEELDGKATVTSFAPVGLGGWGALTDQAAGEFFGPLRADTGLERVALLALLALVAATLAVMNHRRQLILRRHAEEMRELALEDELTGLYNRRGLRLLAEHEMKAARRRHQPLTLLFIDLDGLKDINDHLGHAAGDATLLAMARLLRDTFRDSDVLARLGGDEFCVLLTGTPEDLAVSRLLRNQAEFNLSEARPWGLHFSTGLTEWDPETISSMDEVLRQADESMYQQKRARRQPPASRAAV